MDKLEFLATVAGKLSAYPMPPEDIELGVASVKGFIDKISDAEFAAEPPSDKDAEDIAKDLYDKYLKEKEAKEALAAAQAAIVTEEQHADPETAAEPAKEDTTISYDDTETEAVPDIRIFDQASAETSLDAENTSEDTEPPSPEEILGRLHTAQEPAEPKITTDEEFFEMLAKEAEGERSEQARIEELELKALSIANKEEPETVAQVLSQDEKLQEIVTQSDIAEEFDPIDTAFDPTVRPDEAFEEAQLTRVFTETDEISREFKVDTETLRTVEEKNNTAKTKKENKPNEKPKEKVKGSPLYWTVVILTFPIWFPIFLLISALFGVMYAAVTALIVAVAAVMIGCVALGTGLALIGIIYGVTKCFNTVPIGLFEIGMGIAIGGVTMLVSVLLKYLSMNCMPKLYKLIARLAKLVYGGIGELSIKLKKECGKNK